jgi:hypothetical protein
LADWDAEANVEGQWQIGVSLDDAADLMNRLDQEAKAAAQH